MYERITGPRQEITRSIKGSRQRKLPHAGAETRTRNSGEAGITELP